MRILPRDKDIIARAGFHGDASLRDLARITGHQVHTVRHALDRLREQGILKRVWVIDVLALGWQRFEIFFATGCRNSTSKAALTKYLARSNRVAFLAETGGDYDYELIFLAKDSCEVTAFLEEVSKRHPDAILARSIVIHQQVHYYPRKYLAQGKPPSEQLSLIPSDTPIQTDRIDQGIFELLTATPEILKREIAQRLGISAATVEARLQKLRRNGVIRGALFSVDAAHFGGQNFILLIHTRGVRKEIGESLFELGRKHPHITNIRKSFGPWDYEIGVEVLHYRELVALKEQLNDQLGAAINAIAVLSRFKVHKYVQYPFTANS